MATNYNLNITRGSNFSVRLIAKDENGTPINLSGYSASAQVRHHYSSTGVLLDLSPTPVEPKASGYIDIYLSLFDYVFAYMYSTSMYTCT